MLGGSRVLLAGPPPGAPPNQPKPVSQARGRGLWDKGRSGFGCWGKVLEARKKREGQLEAEAYHLPCSALMPNRWMALSDNIPG